MAHLLETLHPYLRLSCHIISIWKISREIAAKWMSGHFTVYEAHTFFCGNFHVPCRPFQESFGWWQVDIWFVISLHITRRASQQMGSIQMIFLLFYIKFWWWLPLWVTSLQISSPPMPSTCTLALSACLVKAWLFATFGTLTFVSAHCTWHLSTLVILFALFDTHCAICTPSLHPILRWFNCAWIHLDACNWSITMPLHSLSWHWHVGQGMLTNWISGIELWHLINGEPWLGKGHLNCAIKGTASVTPSSSS